MAVKRCDAFTRFVVDGQCPTTWSPGGSAKTSVRGTWSLTSSRRDTAWWKSVAKFQSRSFKTYNQIPNLTVRQISSTLHSIQMPGRTRPIDKLATAAAKCSKEVRTAHSHYVEYSLMKNLRAQHTANAYSQTTTTSAKTCA